MQEVVVGQERLGRVLDSPLEERIHCQMEMLVGS